MAAHTINTVKRWSCLDNELPSPDSIKQLHVYDFDNTLFASPLPNRQVWQGVSIGMLQSQETFVSGGWWHDSNILRATGEGMEKEEGKAWMGWWNEQVVNLVELSMQQRDALTVLLTGRTERGFADIIERMTKSRRLHFDMIVLRPEVGPTEQKFKSTMNFKQVFLHDLIHTYSNADQIRLYEDRIRHVQQFQDFFNEMERTLRTSQTPVRMPIHGEVVEVSENATTLEPVTEIAEVQRMINSHNAAYASGSLPLGSKPYEIKRSVLYTGYLLKPEDTKRILKVAKIPCKNLTSGIEGEYRTLANNVLITPRPCPRNILDRVGGLGHKFRWRVVAIGSFDNKVWAAQVQPVTTSEPYYAENGVPKVVLATKGNGKPIDSNRIQQWTQLQPQDTFEFETEVGEKVLLRVEEERMPANQHANNQASNNGLKRTRPFEEEFPALGAPNRGGRTQQQHGGNPGQRRDFHNDDNRRSQGQSRSRGGGQKLEGGRPIQRGGRDGGASQNRGGRGNHQKGRGGAADSGRGRGSRGAYRSLDDEVARSAGRGNGFGLDGGEDTGLTY